MSFQGMDVDAVEAVSQRLMRQSKEMRSHIPQLDRLVDEAVDRWDGPGRGAIRSDWLARRRDLLAAADAIDTLGRRARDNAAKQREASSADGDTPRVVACVGSWERDRTQLGDPTSHDATLLKLSRLAYDDKMGETLPGWTRVRDISDASGLQATLFRGPGGEMVLAYRGSENDRGLGETIKDWGSNAHGALATSAQQHASIELAKMMAKKYPDIVFTGHSLGGGLAAISSLATGRPAVTFNAAGLSAGAVVVGRARGESLSIGERLFVTADPVLSSTMAKVAPDLGVRVAAALWTGVHNDVLASGLREGQITSYQNAGDILSLIQEGTDLPDAVGRTVVVPAAGHSLEEMERGAGWPTTP